VDKPQHEKETNVVMGFDVIFKNGLKYHSTPIYRYYRENTDVAIWARQTASIADLDIKNRLLMLTPTLRLQTLILRRQMGESHDCFGHVW